MLHGRSMMPIFGGWVMWVHLLSLLALMHRDPPPPPLRPLVSFVDCDRTYECDPEAGPNALSGVEAELSESFDHDIVIPLKAIAGSAKPGRNYAADLDAAVVFKAGQTRGRIRDRDGLADVIIEGGNAGGEPVQFRLELQGTSEVVTAADPQGYREIRIAGAEMDPLRPETRLTKADFTEQFVPVFERELVGQAFTVRAEMPAPKDTDLHFELWRGIGDVAKSVTKFSTVLRQGATDAVVRLADKIPPDELLRLGLADDRIPGPDEYYELRLDARPPLIAAGDPCSIAVLAKDDDEPVTISQILEDEQGKRIRHIEPGVPYWVVPVLSGTLESPCHVQLVIDGKSIPPGGVIPAGLLREPRFGPFTTDDGREALSVEVEAAPRWGPLCESCNVNGDKCPGCKPAAKPCPNCRDRSGGCATCNHGAGTCKMCSGRPGGCLGCGFGRGVCGACKGRPGGCSACGGRAGGGCVARVGPWDVPVGPAVPGDFLLLLVNNQRLHEPGDRITERTMAAIKGEKECYKNAVVLVNEQDEQELKPDGPPPDAARSFRPFKEGSDDLQGQAQRIVKTLSKKRDIAENPDPRAIVIWPERELSSASDLSALKTLAQSDTGPISILCPDADPAMARRLAKALEAGGGGSGRITIRCPKTPELKEHIQDIIQSGEGQ
jgi:hypothetical protein